MKREKKKVPEDKTQRIYIRWSLGFLMSMSNVCKDNRYHKMVFIVIMKTKEEAFKLCNNFYSQTFSPSRSSAWNMLKFSKKRHSEVMMCSQNIPALVIFTFLLFLLYLAFLLVFCLLFSLYLCCVSLLYKYHCNKIINTKIWYILILNILSQCFPYTLELCGKEHLKPLCCW